jgi:hypothetical protein
MSITPEEITTPSAFTVDSPIGVLVSVLLTMEEAEMLRDIMDVVRDDDQRHAEFADDLYITLNRSEEWTA